MLQHIAAGGLGNVASSLMSLYLAEVRKDSMTKKKEERMDTEGQLAVSSIT